MNRLGVVRISKGRPRIKLTIQWGYDEPQGQLLLFLRRAGDELEFAAYPPLEVNGGEITWQFDDMLFARKYGRYDGRFTVGGIDRTTLSLEYVSDEKIISAENASV